MTKLNLGCGQRYVDDYINCDFSNIGSNGETIKVDLTFNLLERIPYNDNSIDEIMLYDVLEHFNRWNGLKVLEEIYRVLKNDCMLKITVPNAHKQLKQLLTVMNMHDNVFMDDFFDAHTNVKYWKWIDDVCGATRYSDGFDGDSHKMLYSSSSLISILKHVGFSIYSIDSNRIKVEAMK